MGDVSETKIDVSVLMSVYNETIEQLDKAVQSILNQTFDAFEFIIVMDNPDRMDLEQYLSKIVMIDNRVAVVKNEKNIGLARSLNIAAQFSVGKYLARMDADDISERKRLEKQYECIELGQYDLVCSSCCYIDDDENVIGHKRKMSDDDLTRHLIYYCTITHPTVMMSRDAFDKVGGYRNFPCSQDYDLWLRFFESGSKMHLIDEELVQYRLRENSIGQSNWVKQMVTAWYIQNLHKERIRYRCDSFSQKSYKEFLELNGVFNDEYMKKIQKNATLKRKVDVWAGNSSKKLYRIFFILILTVKNGFYRKYYTKMIGNKVKIKLGIYK